jgi:YhcH/YjgK/YiaL family protein
MVLCDLHDSAVYQSLSPRIKVALQWLESHISDSFVKGKAPIEGTDIVVSSEEVAMMPREKSFLEAHRRFIDIHVPIKGEETMGWAPVKCLKNVVKPYDEEKDIVFYGESAHSLLHVRVGQIVIFFPDDAHAPNIGIGNHRKLCIKIPIE